MPACYPTGTYGKVYKALPISTIPTDRPDDLPLPPIVAIKKFKPDKEGDVITYTGLSQSAIREISLNRELSRGFVLHKAQKMKGRVTAIKRLRGKSAALEIERQLEAYPSDSESQQEDRPLAARVAKDADQDRKEDGHNREHDLPPCENFARLVEVILEEKSVYMVFEYAEHDLLVSSLPRVRILVQAYRVRGLRTIITANHSSSSPGIARQHTYPDPQIPPASTPHRHGASTRPQYHPS